MLLLFPDPDPILREKPDLNPDPTLNKFGSGSDFTFFLRHKSQYDKYCYTILSLWLLSFADKFHLSWILNIDVQTVIGSNHILKTGSGIRNPLPLLLVNWLDKYFLKTLFMYKSIFV